MLKRTAKIIIPAMLAYLLLSPEWKQSRDPHPLNRGFRVELGALRDVAAAENEWGFVRQSATWANSNSILIDSVITSIQNAGLLTQPANTYNLSNVSTGSGVFNIQIGIGTNKTVQAVAYTGSKTFSNHTFMWDTSNNKAMELFFDSPSDTTGDGALVVYSLNELNSSRFTNTASLVESYVVGTSGSRTQTYSWRNGPLVLGNSPGSKNGRVFLEEMVGGTLLCVQVIVLVENFDFCGSGNFTADGQPDYYGLAYGQQLASPFETTAKQGLETQATFVNDTAINNDFCGSGVERNFGLFTGSGFVDDSIDTGNIPSGYRSGAAIDTLYSQVGRTNTGVGEADDLSRNMIDNLSNSGNAEYYITFRDGTASPF